MGTAKRRATTEVTFNLTMTLPQDVTIQQAQQYVKNAVTGWCQAASSSQDAMMMQMDQDSVRVGLQKKVVTY